MKLKRETHTERGRERECVCVFLIVCVTWKTKEIFSENTDGYPYVKSKFRPLYYTVQKKNKQQFQMD